MAIHLVPAAWDSDAHFGTSRPAVRSSVRTGPATNNVDDMGGTTKINFIYLSEPDMIRAGVTDMPACVDAMEEMFALLHRGDYCLLYTSDAADE